MASLTPLEVEMSSCSPSESVTFVKEVPPRVKNHRRRYPSPASLHTFNILPSKLREVPASVREQQLQQKLDTLQRRLDHYESASATCSRSSTHGDKATKSALLDFLADVTTSAAQLERLLASFPLALNEPKMLPPRPPCQHASKRFRC